MHDGHEVGRRRADALSVLTLYVLLLMVLPGRLVFDPLGGVGRPALLLGLVCTWWWFASKIVPSLGLRTTGRQPVHWVVLPYAAFMLMGYAVAHSRGLTPLESSGSDRAVITLVSLCGIALLVADGIASRKQLDRLLGIIVFGGSLMAFVGLIQFVTGWDPVPLIRVPGLRYDTSFAAIPTRSLFHRPYGTALHPIEFGVVTASILPLAIHFGLHAASRRMRRLASLAAVLLALAVPMSLSRSGIIALTVTMLVLAAGWTWTQRFSALAYSASFVVLVSAAIPGLLGTVRSLFLNAGTDPSIVARQGRVPKVLQLIAQRPWLGRGIGTYSPQDYFLLDNQLFGTAIESGVLGVVVTLALFMGGVLTARGARKRASTEPDRHLGQALAAPIVGLMVATYTFDAFFYPAFTGLLFLYIGAAGALWRLQKGAPVPPEEAERPAQLPLATSTRKVARSCSDPADTPSASGLTVS